VELVTLYVVRQKHIHPLALFTCEIADRNGNNIVDTSDFIQCSQIEDVLTAQACAAVVRVYWRQSCE
jgi:hypothetical protein